MLRTLTMASVLFASIASQAAGQLTCTGLKRTLDPKTNQAIEKVVTLKWAGVANPYTFQGQIEDRVFSVTQTGPDAHYLISITIAPDFTKGVIATTQLNADGRMQLSTVDNTLIYKLECKSL